MIPYIVFFFRIYFSVEIHLVFYDTMMKVWMDG
jgi:hypothetical protein